MKRLYGIEFRGPFGGAMGAIVLEDGVIKGADTTGALMDGTYAEIGGTSIRVEITSKVPINVQNAFTGEQGGTNSLPPVTIDTSKSLQTISVGPLSVEVQLLRDL